MLPEALWLLWPLVALGGGSQPLPPPARGVPHAHFGEGAPPPEHQHDPQGLFWDHAAIWGAQEARSQEGLPPEESRRRLGLLVPLMDTDTSGGVSQEELRHWILRRHRNSRDEALRKERSLLDRDGDGVVTWEEYRREAFGEKEDDFGGSPDPASHRKLRDRARRRFVAADADGDGKLESPELDAFLHPEDFQHMQDVVVQETMEDMDRNGDGFIQVDEYIADLYEGPPGGPEPPEILREREQFLGERDRDGDGRLGAAEVKLWLRPPSPDWAGLEASHLLHHADLDRDGHLTKEEILGHWELFVGSRATDYGQDLQRAHDEL